MDGVPYLQEASNTYVHRLITLGLGLEIGYPEKS